MSRVCIRAVLICTSGLDWTGEAVRGSNHDVNEFQDESITATSKPIAQKPSLEDDEYFVNEVMGTFTDDYGRNRLAQPNDEKVLTWNGDHGRNWEGRKFVMEEVKENLKDQLVDFVTKPIKKGIAKTAAGKRHFGGEGPLPKFGLSGLASAGVGFVIGKGLALLEDGLAYQSCSKQWSAFVGERRSLVDNFVEAMRPAAHLWRGGSWKKSRSWTEWAQSLQLKLLSLSSPNMMEHDGDRVVDLDREYAMLQWCVTPNDGVLTFIQTMAYYTNGYYYFELMQPDWWDESEAIWGAFRKSAIWRVYIEAWGYEFVEREALAARRGGRSVASSVLRHQANGNTTVLARLELAPFVDTLPLEYFRMNGQAAYPPDTNNSDVLASYFKPYLREVGTNQALLLENKFQYGKFVDSNGARIHPIVLSSFDTFWSLPKPEGEIDFVQFVIVAAQPDIGSDSKGAIVNLNTIIFCDRYVDWNGDLVPLTSSMQPRTKMPLN